MAIRPVDLQLAYLAAPQNAAVLNSAQESPAASQQAQAAAFAAEVTRREEHVDGTSKSKGTKVQPRGERERPQGQPRRRKFLPHPAAPAPDEAPLSGPSDLDDGGHYIDVTA